MQKQEKTNAEKTAAARRWEKPKFERLSLAEATSGNFNMEANDGSLYYS